MQQYFLSTCQEYITIISKILTIIVTGRQI